MRLLFVDPGKSFRQIVAAMFADTDVEVGFAGSCAEAERLAEEPWHFVCITRHLPDGSGLALARSLRGRPGFANAPFILFTADPAESLAQDAAAAGITEVFAKHNVGELVNFVARYTTRVKKISGRVLYVEDSPAQALVIQEMLDGLGLTVEWCGSANEAWEAFLSRDYDLVLTDIVLADNSSGATLIARIRSLADERGDIPIIAVTAYDQVARRIDLFQLGINDYVAKPVIEEELASRVRNHIERSAAEYEVRRHKKRTFDEALVCLSRTLNNAGGDLPATLREICRQGAAALGVERVGVWQFAAEQGELSRRAGEPDGDPAAPGVTLKLEDFPGYFNAVLTERVIVANDVRFHPATIELNASYCQPLGIGAMLDVPLGPAERRLGVLCFEHRGGKRYWTAEEESFATAVGDLTTLAFEGHERWLADQQIRLAGLVFAAASEAIMICDRDNRIVTINEAFSDITGYAADEVVGRNPAMFRSGMHDDAYYARMWQSLAEHGKWQGDIWDRRKDGTLYPKRLAITCVADEQGATSHYIAVFTDVTREVEGERQLRYLAYNDQLTRLPNRAHAEATLVEVLAAATGAGRPAAVLTIEIDRFKKINSSFSHAAGDQLLQDVARRLEQALGREAQLARWSGAGFVVILADGDTRHAVVAAQRCIDAMLAPFQAGHSEFFMSLSIGIGVFPEHGATPADLLKSAMLALGYAKDNGGNRYVFFDPEMERRSRERLLLESRLRRAIDGRQFVLHYQPKVDAQSLRPVGMEALLRWSDPREGLILPGSFVGLAEETGQIYPITDWVLVEACRQNAHWHRDCGQALPVAVNLPAGAFARRDIAGEIRRILAEAGLPPPLLELELTESAMIDDPQQVIEICSELKGLGVRVAIDDFGTGYSSLNYLKRLPLDKLKIDQSFIRDLPRDANDVAITQAIIAISSKLGLAVIAEGVETREQYEFLRNNGCNQIQGFYFSRPRPPAEIIAEFRGGTPGAPGFSVSEVCFQ